MPLLSLPREMLIEIISHVASDSHGQPVHDYSLSQNLTGPHFINVLNLSHTCQTLRFLGVTFVYAFINTNRTAKCLDALFTEYPHLAACVRKLVSSQYILSDPTAPFPVADHITQRTRDEYTKKDYWILLQKILGRCPQIRELYLEGPMSGFDSLEDIDPRGGVLEYLGPESFHLLSKIELVDFCLRSVLSYFTRLLNSGHCTLEEMSLYFLSTPCLEYHLPQEDEQRQINEYLQLIAVTPLTLESIRSFEFVSPYHHGTGPINLGQLLAKTMMRVQCLSMTTSPECIYDAVSTYDQLGSNLTKLRLFTKRCPHKPLEGPNPSIHHFCPVIARLSQTLTDFFYAGTDFPICQEMFPPSAWSKIDSMRIMCGSQTRCEGMEPGELRTGLQTLAINRPRAVVNVEWNLVILQKYSSSTYFIESSGAFERFGINYSSPKDDNYLYGGMWGI